MSSVVSSFLTQKFALMINRVVVALLASLVLIPISTLFFQCYLCDTLCVQFSSVVVPIMMMMKETKKTEEKHSK